MIFRHRRFPCLVRYSYCKWCSKQAPIGASFRPTEGRNPLFSPPPSYPSYSHGEGLLPVWGHVLMMSAQGEEGVPQKQMQWRSLVREVAWKCRQEGGGGQTIADVICSWPLNVRPSCRWNDKRARTGREKGLFSKGLFMSHFPSDPSVAPLTKDSSSGG